MIRVIFKNIIKGLFVLLPGLALAQHGGSVLLTVNVKQDTAHKSVDSPIFKINIQNTGEKIILTPKKSILSPYWLGHSFINTALEKFPFDQDCTKKGIIDSNDVAPYRCNVCFFGRSGSDYLNKVIQISPGQTFSIEESIICYPFKRGETYRVKFSLNAKKVGVTGETDWIYFEIPKEHAANSKFGEIPGLE